MRPGRIAVLVTWRTSTTTKWTRAPEGTLVASADDRGPPPCRRAGWPARSATATTRSTTLARISGADLTSFLLDVAQQRAAAVTPAELLRRVRTDRLVEPGTVDARSLHRTIARLLAAVPDSVRDPRALPRRAARDLLGGRHRRPEEDRQHPARAPKWRRTPPTRWPPSPRPAPTPRCASARCSGSSAPNRWAPWASSTSPCSGSSPPGGTAATCRSSAPPSLETLAVLVAALGACDVGPIEVRLTRLRDTFTAGAGRRRAGRAPGTDLGRGRPRTGRRDAATTATSASRSIVRPGTDEVELGDGGFTDWSARLTGDRKRRTARRGPRRRPHRRARGRLIRTRQAARWCQASGWTSVPSARNTRNC